LPAWIWFAVLVTGGLALWKLFALFPNALSSSMDQVYFWRLVLVLVVISAGVVSMRGARASEVLRNVAAWCAVIGVLTLGYTYRSELQDAGLRIRSELVPGYPVDTGSGTIALAASEDGGYHVVGTVNGVPVEFLVDTGASDIVLSPADASRAGLNVKALDYSRVFETAHGAGRGAAARVANLSVGPIVLSDVDVSVNQTAMRNSLLGMAFLKQMKSFTAESDRLILRWKN
jgi:aspartyl protease family protein